MLHCYLGFSNFIDFTPLLIYLFYLYICISIIVFINLCFFDLTPFVAIRIILVVIMCHEINK